MKSFTEISIDNEMYSWNYDKFYRIFIAIRKDRLVEQCLMLRKRLNISWRLPC